MNKTVLDMLKKNYPQGTRVELTFMDDVAAPPIGTKGTVIAVDDIGSILVDWDNGSKLNVVYGIDVVKKLRTCPLCNKEYSDYPAISRVDNKTEICSECGTREALKAFKMEI